MKKTKKILIAVLALVLVAACVCGIGYSVLNNRVPEAKEGVESRSRFSVKRMYVCGTSPNADEAAYETDTLTGIDFYWRRINHNIGSCIEAVLQVTKDGEVVVLSGDLPGKSNSAQLYGEDAAVGNLTLEQLQKINLLYNVEDEQGFLSYRTTSERVTIYVSVLSLGEYLNSFNESNKSVALHLLRFKDESAVPDLHKAIDKINEAAQSSGLFRNVALCLENDDAAAYADEKYPDLQRAATPKECSALNRASLFGREASDVPYVLVYTDAFGKYASERFIRFAQNGGIAVVLVDTKAPDAKPDAQRILSLEAYGADGYVTRCPEAVIQILSDARQAEKESRLAADSTAAP